MADPENSLPFLQMLFPELSIQKIVYSEAEKTVEGYLDSKAVRFDVYLKDIEGIAFTLEMQVQDEKNIPLRSRYYSALMDQDLLYKGHTYDELTPSYIVFICPFDVFGLGLYRYTFYNQCKEVPGLALGDNAVRVILNTTGTSEDINPDMRAFLDYVNGTPNGNAYVRRIDSAVYLAKQNVNWRREYMTYEMEIKIAEKRAEERAEKKWREIGLQEGRAEGLQEGRAEGENRLGALISLLNRDGRDSDIIKVSTDPIRRNELYKEYGLE